MLPDKHPAGKLKASSSYEVRTAHVSAPALAVRQRRQQHLEHRLRTRTESHDPCGAGDLGQQAQQADRRRVNSLPSSGTSRPAVSSVRRSWWAATGK